MVAAVIIYCCAACVVDPNPGGYGFDGEKIILSLSVQRPAGQPETRADVQTTASASQYLPAEQIRELRVVVVSLPTDSRGRAVAGESPTVEVNSLLSTVAFDRFGCTELMFKDIRSDRVKKIYFLANCERDYLDIRNAAGRNLDLGNDATYLPAADGKAPIEEAIFTALRGTYGNAYVYGDNVTTSDYCVPVTAAHYIEIPTVDELKTMATLDSRLVYKIEQPLYLVRAVNKINLTLENNTGSTLTQEGHNLITPLDVRLKSFSLTAISTGKSYLFAHVDTEDRLFDSYQPSPEELALPFYMRRDLNPAWMRWLAAEAEKTQNDQAAYEWLTKYELPETITNVDLELTCEQNNWTSSTRMTNPTLPTEWTSPEVYFPETLYIPDGAKGQEYLLSCTFEIRKADGTIREVTHQAVLPQLESLFRNTHVKVRFSVTDNVDLHLTLVVLPWTNAPEEEWHYTHTVAIAKREDFIKWTDAEADNTETCRLVLAAETTAVGTFTIASPVNDEWYAYIIPLTGDPDAFMFVDEEGNEIETPHGIIDGTTPATIRIRERHLAAYEQHTAKLQIMVRTADSRYMEADVCDGDPTYYTIIQNRNRF